MTHEALNDWITRDSIQKECTKVDAQVHPKRARRPRCMVAAVDDTGSSICCEGCILRAMNQVWLAECRWI